MSHPLLIIGVVILLTLVVYHLVVVRPAEVRARAKLERAVHNDVRPVTRHPQIDMSKCLLCRACIEVCPERHGNDAPLAVVDGRLALVDPLRCIGHGECEKACPTGAITVGLGELENDPTMPRLSPELESVVPGIFVAGELSGLPLIRNAVAHGKAAITTIASRIRAQGPTPDNAHDVVIVGLGPAGLAAALAAEEAGLRFLALEQGDLGGSIRHYPRQKLVFSEPTELPLHGVLDAPELSKEALLEIWEKAAERIRDRAQTGERVQSVRRAEDGLFRVQTAKARYRARAVLLAVGRRGSPRKLGIPGEERTKVTYALVDPGLIRERKVLIVGGGDSAVEAALVLASRNEVTVSYRRAEFFRLHPKNEQKMAEAIKKRALRVLFESSVRSIGERDAVVISKAGEETIANDLTFIMIGGEPPFELLRVSGVLPDLMAPVQVQA